MERAVLIQPKKRGMLPHFFVPPRVQPVIKINLSYLIIQRFKKYFFEPMDAKNVQGDRRDDFSPRSTDEKL